MRLTKPNKNYASCYPYLSEEMSKLQWYENLEEKLGIELFILYKIISHGFYVRRLSGRIAWIMPGEFMIYKDGMSEGWECPTTWFFKDYSKTWALTKEELEK